MSEKMFADGARVAMVVRPSIPLLTSCAIGNIIFLEDGSDISSPNHEYGHVMQYQHMGLAKYLAFIAVPSVTYNVLARSASLVGVKTLEKHYYNMPWERGADRNTHVKEREEHLLSPWADPVCDDYFAFINALK